MFKAMFRVALLSVVISQATFGMNSMEVVRAHLGQFKDKAVTGLVVAKDFCLNNKNKAITWAQQKPVLGKMVNNPLLTFAFAGFTFLAVQDAYARHYKKDVDSSRFVMGLRWLSNLFDSKQSPKALNDAHQIDLNAKKKANDQSTESVLLLQKNTLTTEVKDLTKKLETAIDEHKNCATDIELITASFKKKEQALKLSQKDKDDAIGAALTHKKNHEDAAQNLERLALEKYNLQTSIKDLTTTIEQLKAELESAKKASEAKDEKKDE